MYKPPRDSSDTPLCDETIKTTKSQVLVKHLKSSSLCVLTIEGPKDTITTSKAETDRLIHLWLGYHYTSVAVVSRSRGWSPERVLWL